MQTNDNSSLLTSVDDIMDAKFGKVGTPEREAFRREAYAYCMGQIIHDARKNEKITQQELAARIGSEKSYISKIENGLIEPSVGTFYRIIDALGLRVEIVKPIY
ncbi:helix-turn-helix domain-containing protein [Viscerimonas tarda]